MEKKGNSNKVLWLIFLVVMWLIWVLASQYGPKP